MNNAPTFRVAGRATAATDVTLVERHWTPGCFTVSIHTGARHAERLTEGRLVLIDGAFWGIIDGVSFRAVSDGDVLTVEGRQLKGLTMDRITIPPDFTTVTGAQGYDTVAGPTETCMKHFVAGNMYNPAQPARIVYALQIAADQGRGTQEDKYMSRHDVLADVLAALGETSGLGYDIVPDLSAHKLVFDVDGGMDHTAGQSDRKRVIFDVRRKTALSQQYDHSLADSRNLFYTTMSGAEFADEALTVTYVREGEGEPVGIRRREKHLEVSVDTPTAGDEYNELRRLALIQAERYKPAECFTVEVGRGPYTYREDYRVGDLVTVRNRDWGAAMDARLTEMETRYTGGGITHTATFGTAPLTVFGRLKRQIAKGS